MKQFLLPENTHPYKANLHCHSNWSDGFYSPEELKQLYKAHGYSVLCITDHEGLFDHQDLNDPDFLTLTGYEMEYNQLNGDDWNDKTVVAHLCFYKKDPAYPFQPGFDPAYTHPKFKWLNDPAKRALVQGKGEPFQKIYSPENINEIIRTMKREGFIVTYNHPKWSQEKYETYTQYEGMDNLEVFNYGTFAFGYPDRNGDVYDALLRQGKRLNVTANDDNHHQAGTPYDDMFGGFTVFHAKELTYAAIMEAFENGWFYASGGPLLKQLYVEDGFLCVESLTPLKYVHMISGNRYVGAQRHPDGSPVYEAKFSIRSGCGYMRLEMEDLSGNMAWTNAIYID